MAEIFSDGFESGDTSAWAATTGTPTINTDAAILGTYGYECPGTPTEYVSKGYTWSTDGYVSASFYIDANDYNAADNTDTMLFTARGSMNNARLYLRGSGAGSNTNPDVVLVLRNAANSAYFTGNDIPLQRKPTLLQATYFRSNSATTAWLYMDGKLVDTLSGDGDSGWSDATGIRFGPSLVSPGSESGSYYLDDFILRDDAVVMSARRVNEAIISAVIYAYKRRR